MTDQIKTMVVGDLDTNCHAYLSQGEALVIDPGALGADIAKSLTCVRIVCIVATHGHHDHVCGIRALVDATQAPWFVGNADADAATHALARSVHATPAAIAAYELADPPAPTATLSEGDIIAVGTASFSVIETPGHTPGGIVLLGRGSASGIAFVGDTLFAGSCGRTDLRGGDPDAMAATLSKLKRVIPPSTTLLCGHGAATTMATELESNPWLR